MCSRLRSPVPPPSPTGSTSEPGARPSDALLERAERLDRERELLAERAVGQERVRIAQELHDVVAHTVSLIVVQAQALGATAGSDEVTQATDEIADLGRQAMAEMHRTLQLLRTATVTRPTARPNRASTASSRCSSSRARPG